MFDANEESSKFAAGSGLLDAHAAQSNFGFEVVLAFDGAAGETAEHSYLANVREGIRDGPLEQAFGGGAERLLRSKIIIELFQRSKETGDLGVPGEWLRIMPSGLSTRHR